MNSAEGFASRASLRKRRSSLPEFLSSILNLLVASVVLPCLLLTPTVRAETNSPARVAVASYLPHWVPQAQFAGFYMAQEKGFYTRAGLDLTLLRGGPDQPVLERLRDGKTTFTTTFLSVALEQRSKGLRLVNIAQLSQRSALLLVARKSSGIRTPSDFDGKTVSLWPTFDAQPKALFRKFNVTPRIIPQRNTLNLFLRGGSDVASAMWYNELHLLLNSGLNEDELVVFRYEDYGLNFPEDGIYCMESTVREKPEVCRAFVRASLEGWRYAFEHTDETLDVVMRHVQAAQLATTRGHHAWMLARMKDLFMPPRSRLRMGQLNAEDYENVAQTMKACGLIATTPAMEEFYVDLEKN